MKTWRLLANSILVAMLVAYGLYITTKVRTQHDDSVRFQHSVYQRCLASKNAQDAADQFRRAEYRAFTLITQSPRIDAQTRALYQELATQALAAIQAYHSANCKIYLPKDAT